MWALRSVIIVFGQLNKDNYTCFVGVILMMNIIVSMQICL